MKKISLLISKFCFGHCEGCYLDPRQGTELSLQEITTLAQLLKSAGYEGITLSGGDPLFRKDIIQIIDIFHSLNFDIHLDTTGTPLLNKDFEKEFLEADMSKKISLIGIPYDGSTQVLTNRFRTNWNNMKEETDQILNILDENNFQISINTVVNKYNMDDLNNIYKIITRYSNVKRWELHQFISLSKKSQSVGRELSISETEFHKALDNIDNNKGLEISPKFSHKKANFKYIDFNGDIILLREGNRKVVQNMRDLNSEGITRTLMGF